MHYSLYVYWGTNDFSVRPWPMGGLLGRYVTAALTPSFDVWYLRLPKCELAFYRVKEQAADRYVCSYPYFCVYNGDYVAFAL